MKWKLSEVFKIYLLLVFTRKSPGRVTMETALKKIAKHLKGFNKGLDIGGWGKDKEKYKKMFDIKHYFSANIAPKGDTDLLFDATMSYPFKDNSFDIITSFNLMEHLWDYKTHIKESYRVLKKSGKFVLYIPFAMFYHPDPRDYWRFTEDALKNIFKEYFKDKIIVTPVGIGPFIVGEQSRIVIYDKFPFLLNHILRFIIFSLVIPIDYLLNLIAYILNKRMLSFYTYPLGYLVIAEK